MVPAVVDASVAVKWFVPSDPLHRAAITVRETYACVAPSLLLVEAANALWKYLRLGLLDLEDTIEAVDLLRSEYRLIADGELIADAQRLSAHQSHPVYDCLYVSLARQMRSQLITADERLVRKLSGVTGLHLTQLIPAQTSL